VEAAYQTSKEALCTAAILIYPQSRESFVVDTEENNVGIGGVLPQVQDGQERVVAYYSKTLNKAERNYCDTQRELLAFVRTLKHFRQFL
jgi:hypothetical protein